MWNKWFSMHKRTYINVFLSGIRSGAWAVFVAALNFWCLWYSVDIHKLQPSSASKEYVTCNRRRLTCLPARCKLQRNLRHNTTCMFITTTDCYHNHTQSGRYIVCTCLYICVCISIYSDAIRSKCNMQYVQTRIYGPTTAFFCMPINLIHTLRRLVCHVCRIQNHLLTSVRVANDNGSVQ